MSFTIEESFGSNIEDNHRLQTQLPKIYKLLGAISNCLIARDSNGMVVGVAAYSKQPTMINLQIIEVAKSHRNQGIGKSLVTKLKEMAQQSNLELKHTEFTEEGQEYISGSFQDRAKKSKGGSGFLDRK
jgi:predicted GNAT family acetyltransferase